MAFPSCCKHKNHTRKEGYGDVFNTGLDAVFEVMGRNQPQMRLQLCFNPMRLNWKLIKADTKPCQEPPDSLLEFAVQLLTEQNFHLVTLQWSYEQESKHRVQMAGCRVRKDSVKFVDMLVTVSPEFSQAHEAEMKEYFTRAYEFLKERIGADNIISTVMHMDKKAPCLHPCFVPLTRDGRLSAKEISAIRTP